MCRQEDAVSVVAVQVCTERLCVDKSASSLQSFMKVAQLERFCHFTGLLHRCVQLEHLCLSVILLSPHRSAQIAYLLTGGLCWP